MGNRSSYPSTSAAIEVDDDYSSDTGKKVKFATPFPLLSSPSSQTSVELIQQSSESGTRGTTLTGTKQLRRTVSSDGLIGRLNETFRNLTHSLSCTVLNTTNSNKKRKTVLINSRPWSRVSRKRWQETTLIDDHLLARTCWPVTHVEAIFLPQFPIDNHAEERYLKLRHIASGAFGRVYQVRPISGGGNDDVIDNFALKILSKSQIIDNNAVHQLKDECDIQTVCGHHSFLAECVSYWQTKKTVFLLSKYYPNGELFQQFQKFPLELAQLYVAEIALALDFLHQAGIIYRDLKPENVLLDQEYHVRLVDFGLSKWLSIGSRTRTFCGTLQYMAPEILAGEPYGHATDWWALGVLACRMYTNEYPFLDLGSYMGKSNELDQLIQRSALLSAEMIPADGRKLLPGSVHVLPAEAQDLLRRLLETKPQYRLRSVLQLQRIGLYKNYNWDAVRKKQVSARRIIESEQLLQSNDPKPIRSSSAEEKFFEDFDWSK